MASEDSFDVIVIGGGPGGYVAAIRASQLGLKSACVEVRSTLGGTCLNVGCIPSKALLESSEFFEKTSQHANDYGVEVSGVSANIGKMIERKNAIVKKFTGGVAGLLKKNKVTSLFGRGSFAGPNQVAVTAEDGSQKVYDARFIIVATGSDVIEIPVAKFDGKVVVGSTEALDFEKAPEHLIVIGGGVIGLELGSVWKRLGSKVSVIEALPSILASMDGTVKDTMTKIMTKQGIEIHANTKVKETKVSGNTATVTAETTDGKTVEFKGDKVLVAVGRRAYTDGLNLAAAGVQAEKNGKIPVNDHLQTNVPHIFAIGDVIAGAMLAHKAEEEGVAAAEIIAGKPAHINYSAIPGIVYTWPEVAAVGLTEEQCKEQGLEYRIGKVPFMANGRAACSGNTEGFVKIIADKRTDELLGVHMVGPSVSELVAEVAVAFEFGASAEDLARSVHAHPTLAEVTKEAALAVDKRSINF